MADLRENIARILLTEEELQAKVAEMAALISEDYKDKQLLLVGVLKGSMVFMADLMRKLNINAKIDFMSVSSYGSSTVSSGRMSVSSRRSMSPVSMPASVIMVVTPVRASPRSRHQLMGAEPR